MKSFDEWLLNESLFLYNLDQLKGLNNKDLSRLKMWQDMGNDYEADIITDFSRCLIFFNYLHLVHDVKYEIFLKPVSKESRHIYASSICITSYLFYTKEEDSDAIYVSIGMFTEGRTKTENVEPNEIFLNYHKEHEEWYMDPNDNFYGEDAIEEIFKIILEVYGKKEADLFKECISGKYRTPDEMIHHVRGKVNAKKFNI